MTVTVPYDTISTTSRSDWLFTKCCCCIPLRIGCFILGYLNLIFNTFRTLSLLALTTYVGIATHGFNHVDSSNAAFSNIEEPLVVQVGLLMLVVLCANAAWLLINIACLVGLHKKRPGPIRVYIGFATARLMLSLAGFIYLVMAVDGGTRWNSTQGIVSHSVDLGLTAYFILVYYVYAVQLEREQATFRPSLPTTVNDIAFIYPSKIDQEALVTKY